MFWGAIIQAAAGATKAANEGTPKSLQSSLDAETNNVFSNSFAVGTGASATSSPTTGSNPGAGGFSLSPNVLLLGGAALLAGFLILSRK